MPAEDKDGNRRRPTRDVGGRFTRRTEPDTQHAVNNPTDNHHSQNRWTADEWAAQSARLFSRSDGWLRAVPDFDTGRLYVKWKFTAGRYAGHYVMAVSTLWSFDAGLATLIRKLDEVDCNARRPTRDSYYGDTYAASRSRAEARTEATGDN